MREDIPRVHMLYNSMHLGLTLLKCPWKWITGLNGFQASTYITCVKYVCKVDYSNDKFIHVPTFNDNEVMHF